MIAGMIPFLLLESFLRLVLLLLSGNKIRIVFMCTALILVSTASGMLIRYGVRSLQPAQSSTPVVVASPQQPPPPPTELSLGREYQLREAVAFSTSPDAPAERVLFSGARVTVLERHGGGTNERYLVRYNQEDLWVATNEFNSDDVDPF